jgi:tetratricopeptide (TPR) repeat protein
MEPLKTLFLSIFCLTLFVCKQTRAQSGCIKCNERSTIDSLVNFYINERAEKLGLYYNDPRWQDYCDSIISICPNAAEAYQLKALPFTKYGDYEKAFFLIDQAVKYDPWQFLSYRAFIKCIFTKDYTGALADFKRADSLIKGEYVMDHTHYFFMGLCDLETGHLLEGQDDFARDMTMQLGRDSSGPIHFNTFLYAGILAFRMNKYDDAARYLEECLKIYSQHPEANYYRAAVAERQNDTAAKAGYLNRAKSSFQKGFRMNEGNIFYANYPEQITLYEISMALEGNPIR